MKAHRNSSRAAARYIVNSPDVVNETIDGEVIMINLKSGHYYSTDRVGADIWAQAEKLASTAEIVQTLLLRYEGNSADIEHAVGEFVDSLLRENLIRFDPEAAPLEPGRKDAVPEAGRKILKVPFERPRLQKYSDMQDLLLLDPIHDVDETGWPTRIPEGK